MIIQPARCAQDYGYNDRVERAVAFTLTQILGGTTTNFTQGASPEYDWIHKIAFETDNGLVVRVPFKFELKTSTHKGLNVELFKDDAETIPSGLHEDSSEADYVVYITMEGCGNGAVAKFRVFDRSALVNYALRNGTRTFYPGTVSTSAVCYQVACTREGPPDFWIGDMTTDMFFGEPSFWLESLKSGSGEGIARLKYSMQRRAYKRMLEIDDDSKLSFREVTL